MEKSSLEPISQTNDGSGFSLKDQFDEVPDSKVSILCTPMSTELLQHANSWAKTFTHNLFSHVNQMNTYTPSIHSNLYACCSTPIEPKTEKLRNLIQLSLINSVGKAPYFREPIHPTYLRSKSVEILKNLSYGVENNYENRKFGPITNSYIKWMGEQMAQNGLILNQPEENPKSIKTMQTQLYIAKSLLFSRPHCEDDIARKIGTFITRRSELLIEKKKSKIEDMISKVPGVLDNAWKGTVNTCIELYNQSQKIVVKAINHSGLGKNKATEKEENNAENNTSETDSVTVTIDWDKAIKLALRSYYISKVFNVPHDVLILTGFAAIDIRQIVLCQHLNNLEKIIYVAEIILKTLFKLIVAYGTKLLTSGPLLQHIGGIDTLTLPFGIKGEQVVQKYLGTQLMTLIDNHVELGKFKTTDIVDV